MSKATIKSNDTPARSFRIPEPTIEKLDEMVKEFAEESGRPENRTTVILQLIAREYAKRQKGRKHDNLPLQ
jgi:hypothetical protein